MNRWFHLPVHVCDDGSWLIIEAPLAGRSMMLRLEDCLEGKGLVTKSAFEEWSKMVRQP